MSSEASYESGAGYEGICQEASHTRLRPEDAKSRGHGAAMRARSSHRLQDRLLVLWRESVALRHGHLTLSTLCSGTDGCVDALKAGAPIISVVAGATVRFVGPTPHFFCQDVICYAADLCRNEDRENFFQRAVLHQLCSDLDPRCQQYLLGTQHPQLFVPDMKMALNDLVENAIDGQVAFVPRSSCLVCCWVCHDASGPYVFESRCL